MRLVNKVKDWSEWVGKAGTSGLTFIAVLLPLDYQSCRTLFMTPYRTILIDDHQLFSDGLRLILNASPHFRVVEQVFDSRQALTACLQHRPDLVLLDINMPHLNGAEVVMQLQSLPHCCRTVMLTMYAEKREIDRFKALDVAGFLAKTIPADQLLTALADIMQGKRVINTDSPVEKPTPHSSDYFQLRPKLSKRELQVLRGVRQGLTTEQIALQLELSYFTVQTHRKNARRKLPFETERELFDFLDTLDKN